MAFNAQQRKVSEIFAGDFAYLIPRYQRRYVWEEKQWRELLDDLKYCIEVNSDGTNDIEWSHFLGSFVFEKDQKNLTVIDGQQRLTTLTLMLCTICVIFNELGERDRFNGVTKYIIGTDDLGKKYCRVDNQNLENFQLIVDGSTEYNVLQNKSKLFESSYLSKSPKDNLNIKRCFNFYYSQFTDMLPINGDRIETLTKIKDKVLDLDVIEIIATNQQESYNIFEILNARGVDLKQHELIKNYILKYIQPRTNIDSAKIMWGKIENMLFIENRSIMDLFFTHYVCHKFQKPNKDTTEFRIVKTFCDRTLMSEFLDDIYRKAKIYRWFYYPEECDDKIIQTTLQFFKNNNHRQFRPIFLSVVSALNKKKISLSVAQSFFVFIKNFYFAYGVVCGGKSNTIEDTVYEYARKIENEDADIGIKELIKKLKEYYPLYPQFQSSFKLLGYSNKVRSYKSSSKKRDVQYILKKIEEYWQSKTKELQVSNFTIEHIANDDGTESHCRIGDLIPLAEPINSHAGSQTLSEKMSYYKKSNLISVKNFVDRNSDKATWDDGDIEKRAEHMAKLAYEKIWKIQDTSW